MHSCCCICSGKFQCPRTEHLSSPPLLSSLPSESFCLLPCIHLLLLLHTAASPILFLINTEVENISGDPRLFPATFLPKYLTGCISQCCFCSIHGIDVHVLITQSNEWCKFPTCRCLKSATTSGSLNFSRSNLSLGWFGFLALFRRTRKVITRSWSLPMSAPGKILVIWMLTPDRKRFFTKM